MDCTNEASIEEFGQFIKDDVFREVESVGINGGEPSLVKYLPEYARQILTLPKLKSLNVISNGFNKKKILQDLELIYEMCRNKSVSFHVSISLDGVGVIHDAVRGKSGAFEKTISTIEAIIQKKYNYCDSFDIGCTIVNQNVNNLIELDSYAKVKGYNIKYRLGIQNKRIKSDEIISKFSVIGNENQQAAKEFFHYQISKATTINEKFKYFSIFSWLNSNSPKRMLGCVWKDEGITLDSRGELYYCAVASNSLGSLRKKTGREIFFNNENINHRKNIIYERCDLCIHDYSGKPYFFDIYKFLKFLIYRRFAMLIFRAKARIL
jgi:sulfatase maturation enzyme AslB (radical SAM superfamily)